MVASAALAPKAPADPLAPTAPAHPAVAPGAHATPASPTLAAAVGASWALFVGLGLVMLGNGLQASLLGLRATMEGFGPALTGLINSGYFIGFALGSLIAPWLVGRVGHVRTFAALASLASVAVLLHVLYIEPIGWTLMRVITGVAYAGLYVVAESWLNAQARNEVRGQLLAVYMVVSLAAMGGGPLLLNLADPQGFHLFVLVSVMVSLALIPILITVRGAPTVDAPGKFSFRELYQAAPLGVIGAFMTGISNGALVGLAAVYAQSIGLSVAQVSVFVTAGLLGSVVLQWPVGWLSDRLDRRKVLTGVTFAAALVALFALAATGPERVWVLLLTFALLGGLSVSQYSLSLAHTNDRLDTDKIIAAAGTFVLVNGTGATIGSLAAGAAIDQLGPSGYWLFFIAAHLALGAVAIWRMAARAPVPLEEQTQALYVSASAPLATAAAFEAAEYVAEADPPSDPDAVAGLSSGQYERNLDSGGDMDSEEAEDGWGRERPDATAPEDDPEAEDGRDPRVPPPNLG